MRIDLIRVSKSYGSRQVLAGIDASLVGPGFIAVRGPSGAGKTTLLSILAGQIEPTDGSFAMSGFSDRMSVDWIVQSAPILAHRTVSANIMLGPLSKGLDATSSMRVSLGAAHSLGIGHLMRKRGFSLSGGERQRVAVARSIACAGELVLADEPTAALDAHARGAVCDGLRAAVSSGSLVVVATHDEYVSARADLVITLQPAVHDVN
ncbi:ATP-binding cassette domain-containing protein [Arthrobacter sp. AZCC_0090]|uniref:ATP-binding cassette domain-containing protein n=1 Tax=Arthrobacter sp. AZCC_0090 TaxID=2735881 RepID=UPI0016076528|nr:ATP-binding cassette domain-containing protein [Arthrobacter sp. AZCC_0090]MBB6404917.1 ABC-type lipoprotein export system ATPase subunit [Arthrobacter sp. AZCC_0090]